MAAAKPKQIVAKVAFAAVKIDRGLAVRDAKAIAPNPTPSDPRALAAYAKRGERLSSERNEVRSMIDVSTPGSVQRSMVCVLMRKP
jgi:hypothetical protein